METNIEMIFHAFCASAGHNDAHGAMMDGRQFTKMAKDSKILGKKITTTDMDIIFAKVKAKSARKIGEQEFTHALELLAEKKGLTLDHFVDKIVEAGGPKFHGTRADHVELHDNKESYTGVSAKGGPSTVDGIHTIDMAGIVDRTEGVHLSQHPNKAAAKAKATSPSPKKKAAAVVVSAAPAGSLHEVFLAFTSGAKEMDNRQLAKFSRDTKILDKTLTSTDVDINFSKVKAKGARKITFKEFEAVIELFAAKKKLDFEALAATILARGGPSFNGTKTAHVKLHDDKSTYTGVYTKGGPSTVGSGRRGEEGKVDDLSQLADRTGADVRGTKH